MYDHIVTFDVEVRQQPSFHVFFIHLAGREAMDVSVMFISFDDTPTFIRLRWRLSKYLFLTNRYLIPPILMYASSFSRLVDAEMISFQIQCHQYDHVMIARALFSLNFLFTVLNVPEPTPYR